MMLTYVCIGSPHIILTLNNFYFVSYNVDSCVEFDTAVWGDGTFKLKDYQNIKTWQECGKYLICIS